MTRWPIVMALALGACVSNQAVKRANAVVYQTEFARVWQVVSDEVRKRYTPPDLKLDDANNGKIVTHWRKIRGEIDDTLLLGEGGQQQSTTPMGSGTGGVVGATLMRVEVKLIGGPPWKVVIDGEAALYRPNLAALVPYKRGAPDEPAWVQGRLDALAVAIYERLEKFAVEPAKGTGPSERNFGGVFGDVPADAAQVVGTVQVAARKRDLEALRPHLTADFRWSDGAPGSAETALALWGADPSSLGQLASLLEKGCGHQGEVVTCPAGAATGPRAGFRREGDIWRFAFFLRE